MTERNTPDEPIEERLRAALRSRAASVQAGAGDLDAVAARAAAARHSIRRRRIVLSAAAAVAVVAAVAGAAILNADDDTRVATEGPTTTAAPVDTDTSSSTTTPSSTTTAAPADDEVAGWPGFTARVFDDPEAAALAFVTDVLGFADPALADVTTEGAESEVVYHPRPTASVNTTIFVHDTGAERGWVVTGAQGSEGTIESAILAGTTITVSGSATAFEATVSILVLDQEGNVLAETFTMAGSNGEQGPYEATVEVDPGGATPFWVMIAEGDASGDGRFNWATTAPLTTG